jgi:molybdopterin converting factor small subunit
MALVICKEHGFLKGKNKYQYNKKTKELICPFCENSALISVRCKKHKTIYTYSVYKTLQVNCKKCSVDKGKKYYAKYREEVIKKAKQYYEKNKKKVMDRQTEHYIAHKDKYKLKHKRYYILNREAILAHQRMNYLKRKQDGVIK